MVEAGDDAVGRRRHAGHHCPAAAIVRAGALPGVYLQTESAPPRSVTDPQPLAGSYRDLLLFR